MGYTNFHTGQRKGTTCFTQQKLTFNVRLHQLLIVETRQNIIIHEIKSKLFQPLIRPGFNTMSNNVVEMGYLIGENEL